MASPVQLRTADGFRGIWYSNTRDPRYVWKYSGGLATYPQQLHPIAVYAEAVGRTFFVYGGRAKRKNELLHMISYYDHATGLVARPRILLNKHTDDAHDNPTLAIDPDGYLWIFSNAHGQMRPAHIHRSAEPYAIGAFEHVLTRNVSYAQPWHLPGRGFVVPCTIYDRGRRRLHVWTSPDGRTWSEPRLLARAGNGHYQVSAPCGDRIGTAFNYHLRGKGPDWRTNLYYMETPDGGRTWRNAAGRAVALPITTADNDAMAVAYRLKDRFVYLKDIRYTPSGRPVILYLASGGWACGPENGPRTLTTARWTGRAWDVRPAFEVENNYDFASLYIESDTQWRLIGTTEPGPQRWNTGGEVAIWLSTDQGDAWTRVKQLTANSRYNHAYPRRPLNAHPDFYALWADGHARRKSPSCLYFTDRDGDRVRRLPPTITGDADLVEPEPLA